jgi:cell division protein FtsB
MAYTFIVLCGILYAFLVLRGPNGIPGLLEKRRQVREYEMSNEQLHREIEQKQERIQRLQNDPQEQEIEIRQRLKFAGPGEKVYIIDDKKK